MMEGVADPGDELSLTFGKQEGPGRDGARQAGGAQDRRDAGTEPGARHDDTAWKIEALTKR